MFMIRRCTPLFWYLEIGNQRLSHDIYFHIFVLTWTGQEWLRGSPDQSATFSNGSYRLSQTEICKSDATIGLKICNFARLRPSCYSPTFDTRPYLLRSLYSAYTVIAYLVKYIVVQLFFSHSIILKIYFLTILVRALRLTRKIFNAKFAV